MAELGEQESKGGEINENQLSFVSQKVLVETCLQKNACKMKKFSLYFALRFIVPGFVACLGREE